MSADVFCGSRVHLQDPGELTRESTRHPRLSLPRRDCTVPSFASWTRRLSGLFERPSCLHHSSLLLRYHLSLTLDIPCVLPPCRSSSPGTVVRDVRLNSKTSLPFRPRRSASQRLARPGRNLRHPEKTAGRFDGLRPCRSARRDLCSLKILHFCFRTSFARSCMYI